MSNFLKIDRLLTKNFTQNFKERYHHKRKESQVSIWKAVSQKKHPKKNLPKTWAYKNHSIFLKDLLGLENCIFPWRTIWTDIFDWVCGNTFLQAFWPLSFLGQWKNTQWKKPRRNSVNENSSNVRRNTSPQERWKNHAKRRQTLTCT